MKKLSLLLLTLCISLATWAGVDDWNQPNPYAYDLKSEIINNGTTLKLTYSLNATAVSDKTYNDQLGIQIYLIDENGNRIKKEDGNVWACTSGSYQKGKDHFVTIPIADLPPAAKDKPISWEVVVHGNENWSKPKLVYNNIKTDNPNYYPRAAHGIAIEKNPSNKHFGKIFTAEASTNTINSVSVPNSLWEYDGRLVYQKYHHKDFLNGNSSHFSSTTNYEPHRVKISDDGRVFATCYHTTASDAVIEYIGNGQWKTIVSCGESWYRYYRPGTTTLESYSKLYRRIIGLDVKGSGDDLKIIAAWVTPRGSLDGSNYMAKVEVREYNVGLSGANLSPSSGTVVAEFNDYNTASGAMGLLYQGFRGGDATTTAQWNSAIHGFVDVAYGEGADDPIWMKVDFGANSIRPAKIMLFTNANKNVAYTYTMQASTTEGGSNGDGGCNNAGNGQYGYFGGSGIHIKGDTLFTASGGHKLFMYKIKNNTLTDKTVLVDSKQGLGTGGWVNAFAEDYAGNIYAISEDCDNIVVLATPYDGTRITRAPASQSIVLSDPVPNILATDLRYDIVRGKNQYEFSFNVNTKPEEAQIRFFESYDAMKNSLNTVNADNYDGTNNNKPLFVYNIPSDKLKQGRIAVKLGAVGGQVDANGVITNDRLPAGVLYWSVYVKTRKSNVFAPTCRLEGINDAQGAHRRYATVNNYPETDMFGSFIVADCPTVNSVNGPYNGLMIYGINPEGNSNDDQSNISNGVRYSHRESYLNSGVASDADKLNFPRRLVVAPDGRVFIADQGTTNAPDYGGATSIVQHDRGGVRIWDPADPKKFTLFSHNKIGTSFGVSLWEHSAANGGLKIYASNAYEEYLKHNTSSNYTDAQKDGIFGWNGLAEYKLSAHPNGSATWAKPDSVHYALGRGDASGNYSLVAMDKGIWMCQHREHNRQLKDEALQPLADNLDAVLLSFFPYGSTKAETWNSCTNNGVNNYDDATKRAERADASDLTQKKTSPIQSTPGAGMAYRKIDGKEYLFVVNHDGNIAQILIEGWTGSGATATPIIDASKVKILVTPAYTKGDRDVDKTSTKWHTAFITTINFDYAGNMVTTTGKSFGQAHDIIVYTMPYDRVNAREIQAPNSCRMIPERIAQLDMTNDNMQAVITEHRLEHPTGCAVDIYRPLQGGMFNTICLPFELYLGDLPETHPLYDATLREYTGLNLNTIGGEKVLELVFTDVANNTINANIPYIIKLKDEDGYNSIMRFAGPIQLTSTEGESVSKTESGGTYSIIYKGIIPYQRVEPHIDQVTGESLTLMLVADNRLALMTSTGDMYGFRGYFTLNKPLPRGMQTRITNSKGTTTNTTIVVDGKKVNVEKYLREGRVYIRVGETLYTIDGQKVE